jgi:hypothetical protein
MSPTTTVKLAPISRTRCSAVALEDVHLTTPGEKAPSVPFDTGTRQRAVARGSLGIGPGHIHHDVCRHATQIALGQLLDEKPPSVARSVHGRDRSRLDVIDPARHLDARGRQGRRLDRGDVVADALLEVGERKEVDAGRVYAALGRQLNPRNRRALRVDRIATSDRVATPNCEARRVGSRPHWPGRRARSSSTRSTNTSRISTTHGFGPARRYRTCTEISWTRLLP